MCVRCGGNTIDVNAELERTDLLQRVREREALLGLRCEPALEAVREAALDGVQSAEVPSAFAIGAISWGIPLAAFASWALEELAPTGVVCAFLREGELFAPLVNAVAAERGHPLRAIPFPISRRSSLALAHDVASEALVRELARRRGATVGAVAEMIGVTWTSAELRENESCDAAPLEDLLVRESLRPTVIDASRVFFAEQRKLVAALVDGVGHGGQLGTLDVGVNGTIQARLSGAFPGRFEHRTLVLAAEAGRLGAEGVGLDGFLASPTQGLDAGRRFARTPELYEQPWMGARGTCLRYERRGDAVHAVEGIGPSSYIAAARRSCHAGVLAVSRAVASDDSLVRLAANRSLARAMLMRPQLFPIAEEIALFETLLVDDNVGAEKAGPILRTMPIAEAANAEWLRAHRLAYERGFVRWPEGEVERTAPGLLVSDTACHPGALDGDRFYPDTFAHAAMRVARAGTKFVWLLGAGQVGRAAIRALHAAGVRVDGVIDAPAAARGLKMEGIRVSTDDEALDVGVREVFVASFANEAPLGDRFRAAAARRGAAVVVERLA